MTLVLTELSNAGIAMATDSAITRFSRGRIVEIDQRGWKKLLRVPSIKAAISYWGIIGAVTRVQFDVWLQRVIDGGGYTDLESFADHLADALNDACRGKPLQDGQDVVFMSPVIQVGPTGNSIPSSIMFTMVMVA